jgi:hypothetical protein
VRCSVLRAGVAIERHAGDASRLHSTWARTPELALSTSARERRSRNARAAPRERSPAQATASSARAALPWQASLALVLSGGFLLQFVALRSPFFADDYLFLQQVRDRSLPAALASPDPIGNFARPVGRQLHFWWLSQVSGESPFAFHLANLILFLGAIALLFALTRRMAGARAATIASAFVALHYAADVPLRWASGSQDLLAIVGALATLWLFLRGQVWAAAAVFLAALLSKETVALTPVIAMLAGRRAGESWRASVMRAWPLALALGLAVMAWVGLAVYRTGSSAPVQVNISGAFAALVHLVQVSVGFEWRSGESARFLRTPPPWVPLALSAVAVWFALPKRRREQGDVTPPGVAPVVVGLAWALVGALPIAAVASIWSAYYYLFALCGVGLALGAWGSRLPAVPAIALVVLLAWGSQNGRQLDEFATGAGAWTAQSHVNRFYLDRAMGRVSRYVAALRAARPTLPPRSTLFFTGLPGFLGFQTADGPLVRWAYRDSSLRSYFLYEFTGERYRRGPAFFFSVAEDSLREEPMSRRLFRDIAFNALQNGQDAGAFEALSVGLEADSTDSNTRYWMAWVSWARGDSAGARRQLRAGGFRAERGPTPEVATALERVAQRDTLGALRTLSLAVVGHALDPETHAMLAGVLVDVPSNLESATIEAYAARVLAPGEARNWWRWGYVQYRANRFVQAVPTLERYLAMPGRDPDDEADARRLLEILRGALPGGALVQGDLRQGMPGEGPDK